MAANPIGKRVQFGTPNLDGVLSAKPMLSNLKNLGSSTSNILANSISDTRSENTLPSNAENKFAETRVTSDLMTFPTDSWMDVVNLIQDAGAEGLTLDILGLNAAAASTLEKRLQDFRGSRKARQPTTKLSAPNRRKP